ncbi:tRNAHis guanylyltransferase-domain-containing protein [Cladochytrium replicatum]|nr:tRNAHis guanylyltransferase-domain-containing protein [Cladochytrium replicatum]
MPSTFLRAFSCVSPRKTFFFNSTTARFARRTSSAALPLSISNAMAASTPKTVSDPLREPLSAHYSTLRSRDAATTSSKLNPPDIPELMIPQSAYDALYGMYGEEIGARLKVFEKQTDAAVPPESMYVIRLDGVAFHTFTKGLKAPFDDRLTDSMVRTTVDLVAKFNACMGYCQSDEISLVFPAAIETEVVSPGSLATDLETAQLGDSAVAEPDGQPGDSERNPNKRPAEEILGGDEEAASSSDGNPGSNPKKKVKKEKHMNKIHAYSGRIQKLATTTASYATARLNFYLSRHEFSDLAPHVAQRMRSHIAYFDGRVIPLPSAKDAMETVFWRSNLDGIRNAISAMAQAKFSAKQLHKKGCKEKLRMLADAGVDSWMTYSPRAFFGTWVKKESYVLEGATDPRTGQPVPNEVIRTRVRTGTFNWADWSVEDRIRFMLDKYWRLEDGHPGMDPLEGVRSNYAAGTSNPDSNT